MLLLVSRRLQFLNQLPQLISNLNADPAWSNVAVCRLAQQCVIEVIAAAVTLFLLCLDA